MSDKRSVFEISTAHARFAQNEERLHQTERSVGSQFGGGSGTSDGMSERLTRLEVRADGVERRLDVMDGKLDRIEGSLRDLAVTLGRLPSKEFLVGTVLAALGIAIAFAALTFNIADYASKTTQQAEQAKAAQAPAAPPQPQPIIITIPQPAMLPAQPPAPPQPSASPRQP